jgi:hypothetical protein
LRLTTAGQEAEDSESFHHDDESGMFLRNVGSYQSHTASYPGRQHPSNHADVFHFHMLENITPVSTCAAFLKKNNKLRGL